MKNRVIRQWISFVIVLSMVLSMTVGTFATGVQCHNSTKIKDYDSVVSAIAEAKPGDVIQILEDIDLSETIVITDTTTPVCIDLNGHVINGKNITKGTEYTSKASIFYNEGSLEIIDTSTSAVHYFEYSSTAAWTLATGVINDAEAITVGAITSSTEDGTIIKVFGGVIIGGQGYNYSDSNKDYSAGGAIYNKGILTVSGINFIGNTSTYRGGAVEVDDGYAYISGCAFYGNTSEYGGAIAAISSSSLYICGGVITNNTALKYGAGIYSEITSIGALTIGKDLTVQKNFVGSELSNITLVNESTISFATGENAPVTNGAAHMNVGVQLLTSTCAISTGAVALSYFDGLENVLFADVDNQCITVGALGSSLEITSRAFKQPTVGDESFIVYDSNLVPNNGTYQWYKVEDVETLLSELDENKYTVISGAYDKSTNVLTSAAVYPNSSAIYLTILNGNYKYATFEYNGSGTAYLAVSGIEATHENSKYTVDVSQSSSDSSTILLYFINLNQQISNITLYSQELGDAVTGNTSSILDLSKTEYGASYACVFTFENGGANRQIESEYVKADLAIKTQPTADDDYRVYTNVKNDEGVEFKWYKYVDGISDIELTTKNTASLGTVTTPGEYYCIASYASIADSKIAKNVRSTTVYAFNVEFDTNGGSAVDSQAVLSGCAVATPVTSPTRANAKFNGWFDNEGVKANFSNKITTDTAFNAHWILNKTVTEETLIDTDEDNGTTTKIKVEGDANVKAGGLEGVAKSVKKDNKDKDVKIVLTAEAKSESGIGNSIETDAIKASASAINSSNKLDFFSIKLDKYISGSAVEAITDTGINVVEVIVPYSLSSKNLTGVFTYHDGAVSRLTLDNTKAGTVNTYYHANGELHIFTTKFSTYAVSYTEVTVVVPSTPVYYSPSVKTYTVTCNSSANGTISSDVAEAESGETVTITITPNSGYEFKSISVKTAAGNDVTVSTVTAGKSYSFEMPSANVSVSAEYESVASYKICPKDNTCVLAQFDDVVIDSWYHDGAHFCVENTYIKGSAGKFMPSVSISRGMIATILFRIEGEVSVDYLMSFTDVEEDFWYTEGIRWAQSTGVVKGFNNEYKPYNDATREELATVLYRYAKYRGYDVSVGLDTNILSYDDAMNVSDWAMEAMQWAVGEGIVTGSDNKLKPSDSASRAEAAAMIQRFCEKVIK